MMIVTGNNTENAPVVLYGKATYEIEFRVHVEFLKLQKLDGVFEMNPSQLVDVVFK